MMSQFCLSSYSEVPIPLPLLIGQDDDLDGDPLEAQYIAYIRDVLGSNPLTQKNRICTSEHSDYNECITTFYKRIWLSLKHQVRAKIPKYFAKLEMNKQLWYFPTPYPILTLSEMKKQFIEVLGRLKLDSFLLPEFLVLVRETEFFHFMFCEIVTPCYSIPCPYLIGYIHLHLWTIDYLKLESKLNRLIILTKYVRNKALDGKRNSFDNFNSIINAEQQLPQNEDSRIEAIHRIIQGGKKLQREIELDSFGLEILAQRNFVNSFTVKELKEAYLKHVVKNKLGYCNNIHNILLCSITAEKILPYEESTEGNALLFLILKKPVLVSCGRINLFNIELRVNLQKTGILLEDIKRLTEVKHVFVIGMVKRHMQFETMTVDTVKEFDDVIPYNKSEEGSLILTAKEKLTNRIRARTNLVMNNSTLEQFSNSKCRVTIKWMEDLQYLKQLLTGERVLECDLKGHKRPRKL